MMQSITRARLINIYNLFSSAYFRNIRKYIPRKGEFLKVNSLRAHLSASLFAFVQTVHCLEAAKDLNKNVKDSEKDISVCILQSDEYFKVGKYTDSYKTLAAFEECNNAEVLWRLARSLYNMSKQRKVKHSEQVEMIEHAYRLIGRALILDDNSHAVHKWMAILLDAKFSFDGIKARLQALPDFKKHLQRAMELDPKDATTIYILGQYCYNIASMPWYQRKIAATLLATPPEATFQEALYYFTKAEEAEPNFYSLNLLMLGKTYLQLKKIEAARYWLKCASTYPIRTEEDKQVKKEAEELLKKNPPLKFGEPEGSFKEHAKHKNNE